MGSNNRTALIIGAGPAGLTACLELLRRTDIHPIVVEKTSSIGGISRTVEYKGNRIDIGGHRFFSKSRRVMDWWLDIFPLQGKPAADDIVLNRQVPLSRLPDAPDPEQEDRVMLYRNRVSRILFMRKFFDYPVSLNIRTLKGLGFLRTVKIGTSYMRSRLMPLPEKNLEDFFINRFGRELYRIFFKDYTEKVWGLPCRMIAPEWGAQRIKGVSVMKAVTHAFKKAFVTDRSVRQRSTETSMIEHFLYPKLGPGHFWQECASIAEKKGAEIRMLNEVVSVSGDGGKINSVRIRQISGEKEYELKPDLVFSSMPVRELIGRFAGYVPENVRRTAQGLLYRDFITVGLLLRKLRIENNSGIAAMKGLIPDNWIYIQENDVKVGRIQFFNNWSPYLVKDREKVWIGMEYFTADGDVLWNMRDDRLSALGAAEAQKLGFIEKDDIIDSVVVRSPKAYPAYFGTFGDFDRIRSFTDGFEDLFLIGRNGMHRYNNQDHSMLSAMVAVDNVVRGSVSKDNIWAINTEKEYHEKE